MPIKNPFNTKEFDHLSEQIKAVLKQYKKDILNGLDDIDIKRTERVTILRPAIIELHKRDMPVKEMVALLDVSSATIYRIITKENE